MPLTTNAFTPSTTIRSALVNANFAAIAALLDGIRPQVHFFLPDVQVVANNVSAEIKIATDVTLYMDAVTLQAKTAPTGAALIIDILKNGSTIFTTKPEIAAGATTGGSAAAFSGSTPSVTNGDVLTINVTQVGSTEPGRDVTVGLSFYL